MARKALFEGLIVDEYDRPVEVTTVGDESFYLVDDGGFKFHISSEQVDRQVLKVMTDNIEGNEDLISEQTAKMMGQDDIFTRAMLMQQLKHMDEQLDQLLMVGIPEDSRAYLGMLGFRVRINHHGDVIEFNQPGAIDPGSEGE